MRGHTAVRIGAADDSLAQFRRVVHVRPVGTRIETGKANPRVSGGASTAQTRTDRLRRSVHLAGGIALRGDLLTRGDRRGQQRAEVREEGGLGAQRSQLAAERVLVAGRIAPVGAGMPPRAEPPLCRGRPPPMGSEADRTLFPAGMIDTVP